MGVCNAGFELGVTGATILTTDPGDGTPWDAAVVGTGGTLIYDTTHVALGAQACKIATSGTAASVTLQWGAAFGTQTDHFGRIYVYFTAFPAATLSLVQAIGASAGAQVQISSAGKILLRDTAGQRGVSTNAIGLNQLVRIEYHFVHDATAGALQALLFNTATSGTPTETLTGTSVVSTNANATSIKIGVCAALSNVGPFWIDSIQAGASAYPGAAAVGRPSRMLLGVG